MNKISQIKIHFEGAVLSYEELLKAYMIGLNHDIYIIFNIFANNEEGT